MPDLSGLVPFYKATMKRRVVIFFLPFGKIHNTCEETNNRLLAKSHIVKPGVNVLCACNYRTWENIIDFLSGWRVNH